jgi:hypothetical protein
MSCASYIMSICLVLNRLVSDDDMIIHVCILNVPFVHNCLICVKMCLLPELNHFLRLGIAVNVCAARTQQQSAPDLTARFATHFIPAQP